MSIGSVLMSLAMLFSLVLFNDAVAGGDEVDRGEFSRSVLLMPFAPFSGSSRHFSCALWREFIFKFRAPPVFIAVGEKSAGCVCIGCVAFCDKFNSVVLLLLLASKCCSARSRLCSVSGSEDTLRSDLALFLCCRAALLSSWFTVAPCGGDVGVGNSDSSNLSTYG